MCGIDRVMVILLLAGACVTPAVDECEPSTWATPSALDRGPHLLPEPDGNESTPSVEGYYTAVALAGGALVAGAPYFVDDNPDGGSHDGDQAWLKPDNADSYFARLLPPLAEDKYRFGGSVASVGDVTGDARLDFAIGYLDTGRLELGSHRGARTPQQDAYAAWVDVGGDRGLAATRCGDVDGAGRPDLCTTGGVWSGPVGAGPAPLVSWPVATDVASGDVDADGDPDLLLAEGATVWWVPTPFVATGSVALGDVAAATVALDEVVTALAVADLDGDCAREVVLGTTTGARVGHLDADGFHERFAVPGAVDAVVTGDFDGDGTTDLVLGGGAEVRWLRGPVSASTEPVTFRTAQWPDDALGTALAAEDADGDGVWDLAIGAPRYRAYDWDLGSAVFWLEGLSP